MHGLGIVLCFQQGKGPDGSRGARVLWVLDGHYLLVSGFEKYKLSLQISIIYVDKFILHDSAILSMEFLLVLKFNISKTEIDILCQVFSFAS